MCGYSGGLERRSFSEKELVDQMEFSLKGNEDVRFVKIFTSGSFLDEGEIPNSVALRLLTIIKERIGDVEILIESRPEYINNEILSEFSKRAERLNIAVGLETSNDLIRNYIIGKRFSYSLFRRSAIKIIDNGIKLKTYLLMKPPFLTEAFALDDMKSSIQRLAEDFHGSCVSVNPMNIQKNTPLERLYKKGLYRPPFLWSLFELFRWHGSQGFRDLRLMSSPSGGGKKRGVHNCGSCDEMILSSIEDMSLDPYHFPKIEPQCSCKKDYLQLLSNNSI